MKRKKRKKRFFKFYILFVLFLVFVFFTMRILKSIPYSKLFPVKFIEIEGVKFTSKKEVLNRIEKGKSIFFYTSGRIKDILKDLKWIKRVRVIFDFPSKVIVRIKEREPCFGFKKNGKIFVFTEDKSIIEYGKEFFPYFENIEEVKEDTKEEIVNFIIFLKNKKEKWYKSIRGIRWDEDEGIILKMRHFLVKWGRPKIDEIEEKFVYLEKVMRHLGKEKKFPKYIDLRFCDKKEVIVKEDRNE
ncbi:MAG: hypothetical protein DRI36_01700 [Caldiserica bacterium]|nr:MAG: hypothetical protein DRI36_01700 [Caldisericota bacterium]